MRVRNGHLPYAEVGRHRREVFPKSQGQDVPPVVPTRQLCLGDSPCSQQRREEDDDRDDVKERDGDRVRESIEDDLVNDVSPRTDSVPAHAQRNYPDPFPDRDPLHRSHLPARSDEAPEDCLVATRKGSCSMARLPTRKNARAASGPTFQNKTSSLFFVSMFLLKYHGRFQRGRRVAPPQQVDWPPSNGGS